MRCSGSARGCRLRSVLLRPTAPRTCSSASSPSAKPHPTTTRRGNGDDRTRLARGRRLAQPPCRPVRHAGPHTREGRLPGRRRSMPAGPAAPGRARNGEAAAACRGRRRPARPPVRAVVGTHAGGVHPAAACRPRPDRRAATSDLLGVLPPQQPADDAMGTRAVPALAGREELPGGGTVKIYHGTRAAPYGTAIIVHDTTSGQEYPL